MTTPNKKGRGLPANAPIQKLLSALYQKTGHEAKPNGKGFMTLCPAHDDRTPSLSVLIRDDGSVWPTCFSGCDTEAILEAIHLTKTDLFPSTKTSKSTSKLRKRRQKTGVSEVQGSSTTKYRGKTYPGADEAVAALDEFIESRENAKRVNIWWYQDASGEQMAAVVRYNLPTPEGEKQRKSFRPVSKHPDGWRWSDPPGKWPLYRLDKLKDLKTIIVCEGEKAVDAVPCVLPPATTNAHGAQSPSKTDWSPLAGKEVIIFPDNDEAGMEYANAVANELHKLQPRPTVKLVELPGLPDKGDFVDFIELHGNQLALAVVKVKNAIREAKVYELKPIPKTSKVKSESGMPNSEEFTIPEYVPFPTDLLPGHVCEYIKEAAAALCCDESYVALPLLAALASSVGNSRRVLLKSSWTEPCVLWTIVVGVSGTLKSPAWEKGTCFLQQLQEKEFAAFEERSKAYKRELNDYEIELSNWKKKGRKDGQPQPEQPLEPKPIRYICSDATVEATAVLLEDNPRGILLTRDELSGWICSFDAYKSTRGADAPHWLSMHRAGSIVVDRKTGRRVIYVPRAAVSIAGSVQPDILKLTVVGKGDDEDEGNDSIKEHLSNGLLARLLLAYPPTQAKKWTDRAVSEKTLQRIGNVFEFLFSLEGENHDPEPSKPIEIPFSPEAKQEYVKFFDAHSVEQIQLEPHLAAAWSKLEAYAARFALLFHLIKCASTSGPPMDPSQINLESVAAGIELARWFGEEAVRIYAVIGASSSNLEQLLQRTRNRIVRWIAEKGGTITSRELQQGMRQFKTAAEADKALCELVELGIGKWEQSPRGQSGRPTRRFKLLDNQPTVDENGPDTQKDMDSVDDPLDSHSVCDEWGEV